MTTTMPTPSVESLRGLCEVHLPGDPGYDAARMPWNVAVDQRPAAVALPRSADEVAAVVRAAAASGLRVAPQSTGHGAGPLDGADLSDVVLLRMSAFTGVTVDGEARTARVVGGTQWREVALAAAEHGLACMHGSAPDIGAAGYLTSGGLSFYGRTHGVAAGSVRAVEVVTADGEVVRADADTSPDLFWAVRGGGGNFGVVVAVEIDLLPYADVHAGMLLWPADRAPEVIRAWAAWARTAPESATTSLRVMSFPPLPELPPFLSGRDVVVIDGAVLEDDDRAAEVLAPFRALAPEMDTFGRIPAPGAARRAHGPTRADAVRLGAQPAGRAARRGRRGVRRPGRDGQRERAVLRRAAPPRRRVRAAGARRGRGLARAGGVRAVLHRGHPGAGGARPGAGRVRGGGADDGPVVGRVPGSDLRRQRGRRDRAVRQRGGGPAGWSCARSSIPQGGSCPTTGSDAVGARSSVRRRPGRR